MFSPELSLVNPERAIVSIVGLSRIGDLLSIFSLITLFSLVFLVILVGLFIPIGAAKWEVGNGKVVNPAGVGNRLEATVDRNGFALSPPSVPFEQP